MFMLTVTFMMEMECRRCDFCQREDEIGLFFLKNEMPERACMTHLKSDHFIIEMPSPYVHPAKTEKAQPLEITPTSIIMVPKPGFEPGQAYTH
jgi:hypothetical protein